MTVVEIVAFLEQRRWPLTSEKRTQMAIAEELRRAGAAFEREVRLSPDDVIDFVIGDIGIEVKVRGQRREIYRQCERYCAHERIQALILATNAAMGMPESINDKPVFIARLGRAWL